MENAVILKYFLQLLDYQTLVKGDCVQMFGRQ